MITVQEHLCRIVDTVKRLSPTGLDLLDAQGCVLARDVTSEVDLPGFTNSAMDGYAVHAADLLEASPTSPADGYRASISGLQRSHALGALSEANALAVSALRGGAVPKGDALSVARALALIDMVKAVDRHARISDGRVTAKSGGRSGDWVEP